MDCIIKNSEEKVSKDYLYEKYVEYSNNSSLDAKNKEWFFRLFYKNNNIGFVELQNEIKGIEVVMNLRRKSKISEEMINGVLGETDPQQKYAKEVEDYVKSMMEDKIVLQ